MKQQQLIISLIFAITVIAFQNCSDMDFSSAESVNSASKVPNVAEQNELPSENNSNERVMNTVTSVRSKAFMLFCNKDVRSITGVDSEARVVIVDGHLGSVTQNLGEILMVNSNYGSSGYNPPSLTYENSPEEINQWRLVCSSHGISGPQSAHYQNTYVSKDFYLGPINTQFLEVTEFGEGSESHIKTEIFSITGVGLGASVYLY